MSLKFSLHGSSLVTLPSVCLSFSLIQSIIIWKFNTVYIFNIYSPFPPLPPGSSSLLPYTISSSLKKIKIKQNKNKNRHKRKCHGKTWHLICVDQHLLSVGLVLECGWYFPSGYMITGFIRTFFMHTHPCVLLLPPTIPPHFHFYRNKFYETLAPKLTFSSCKPFGPVSRVFWLVGLGWLLHLQVMGGSNCLLVQNF